jgi:hypothetical protein
MEVEQMTEDEQRFVDRVVEASVRRTASIYKEELDKIAKETSVRLQLLQEHSRIFDERLRTLEAAVHDVQEKARKKRKRLSREAAFGLGVACAAGVGLLVVGAKNAPQRRISQ